MFVDLGFVVVDEDILEIEIDKNFLRTDKNFSLLDGFVAYISRKTSVVGSCNLV